MGLMFHLPTSQKLVINLLLLRGIDPYLVCQEMEDS